MTIIILTPDSNHHFAQLKMLTFVDLNFIAMKSLATYVLPILLLSTSAFYQCRNTTYQHTAIAAVNASSTAPARQSTFVIPFDTLDHLYHGLKRKRAISDFYRRRNGEPLWHHNGRSINISDSLITLISQSYYYGLSPSRYHWSELHELKETQADSTKQRYELLLTDACVRLHQELKWGTLESTNVHRDTVSLLAIEGGLRNRNISSALTSHQPDHIGYRELLTSLKKILDSAATDRQYGNDRIETIQTIAVNLERWRRDTVSRDIRHTIVNIPSYMIHILDHEDTILASRVIVGKPDHATPELTSIIECFTIYPYWHVPRKIAVEEYLPVIQKDTTFLSKNNFDVLDRKGNLLDPTQVPWASYNKNNFPVVLRQREGTDNALGVIKFTFDNPYAVYLHDTNAKRLFKSDTRAFSHGCIRMEQAEKFAHYLMTGNVKAQSRFVKKYLDTRTRAVINLPEPLPIYVRYFTAEVVGGVLTLYPDIYKYDTAVIDRWKKSTDPNQVWNYSL